MFSSHAWTTLNGWINMQIGTIQGHHPMHIFLKCIFTCMSTSTSFEYTSGTSKSTSFYFSSPQNNITKLKRGTSPRGCCCTVSISWGSPFFHTVSQLLQHLLCSHWALLNGPTLSNFSFLERDRYTAPSVHCDSSLNQISSSH